MGNMITTKTKTNQAATRPSCFPDTSAGSGLHFERDRIMEITGTGKNTWDVASPSGNTYHVSMQTKLDAGGSMFFRWSCDCPSRKYPCKHAVAVEAGTDSVDEQSQERTD